MNEYVSIKIKSRRFVSNYEWRLTKIVDNGYKCVNTQLVIPFDSKRIILITKVLTNFENAKYAFKVYRAHSLDNIECDIDDGYSRFYLIDRNEVRFAYIKMIDEQLIYDSIK